MIQGQKYDLNLCGGDEIMIKIRVLTIPAMLYGSIGLGSIFGGEYNGMFVINLIFYFLIVFVFFELVRIIYESKKIALIASILFFTNYCLINYGITFRTDIGGWFFFLFSALFAVKYFKKPANEKWYYLSVLTASVGVLFKEYGALGLIPLGVLILFLPMSFKEKVKKIFKTAILFLIIPALYHLFIYWRFHFSYIDRYLYAVDTTIYNIAQPGINWSIILLIKVLGWLFLVGWPIFLFGLYQEYKNFNKERAKILLAILPASLSFLAWPGLTQRIAFVFVPWLAMISAYGLSKIKYKYIIILILLIYVIVNYFTRPWLLQLINI